LSERASDAACRQSEDDEMVMRKGLNSKKERLARDCRRNESESWFQRRSVQRDTARSWHWQNYNEPEMCGPMLC